MSKSHESAGREALPIPDRPPTGLTTYDGLAKGGTVTLYVDGAKLGEGRVEATQPMTSPATRRPTSEATAPRP